MHLLTLIVLLVTSTVLAQQDGTQQNRTQQDGVLTLEQALTLAPEVDAEVITARANLTAAEREQRRLEADPLALRLPRLEAEQSLRSAQDAVVSAVLNARAAVTGSYTDALEADDTLRSAEMAQQVAAVTLEASEIRLEAGAATVLDVSRARNDLSSAQRELRNAQQARTLAYGELASLLNQNPDTLTLSAEVDPGEVPGLDDVLADLDQNTTLRSAQEGVELARAQLETVNNAFSPRTDIDAARDALDSARTGLQETRRSLEITLRQVHNAALSAQAQLDNARAELATASEDLDAQQVRFEAGSISPLELEQARLDYATSEAQTRAARYALMQALLQLEQTLQGAGGAGGS